MSTAPHLDAFLEAARYFIGLKESGNNTFKDPRGREMLSLYGSTGYRGAWCAVFVSACAQKAGIAGTLVKKHAGVGGLQAGVISCGGKWIDGPYINGGHAVTPAPGDIISFATKQYHGHGHGSHVGIVERVDDKKVYTIEGNTSDQCKRKEYSLGYSAINCYARPDWSKVGDIVGGEGAVLGPLYETRNDRHDMTLRQVGYLDSNYVLSNNTSGVAISAINYTSVLGDLYDLFAPATLNEVKVDTSKLTGNTKIAMDYLLQSGFSASSAAGITGCMKTYSNLSPSFLRALENGKFLNGLCAWGSDILPILKSRLGDNWNLELSGQLEYFKYDMETNYKVLLALIQNQALHLENTDKVVIQLMNSYNRYYKTDDYIEVAKNHAHTIYNSLVITQTSVVGNINNLRDSKGNLLSAKYCVTVPSSVPQTGIIDDFTSYSAWYSKWHRLSGQKKLAVLWGNQGFPSDKGVATIGGYYCVATAKKFGDLGDVIVVSLEGGAQFAALICDLKGDLEWGHTRSGGKITMIEWERVKTQNGKVITGTSNANVDPNGLKEYFGKKVQKITNYGKYIEAKWG